MKTVFGFALATTLLGVAALGVGCIAQPSDVQSDGPIASAHQDLAHYWWFSYGGQMNSSGTKYSDGTAYSTDLKISTDGNVCMLTGVTGNLLDTSDSGDGILLYPDSTTGTWWLQAKGAANAEVNAAAVCFPASNYDAFPQGELAGTLTSGDDPSQEACGFQAVAGALGTPSLFTVSDEGTNPNVNPLGGSTWTYTDNDNINYVGPTCLWTSYSGWYNWFVSNNDTITETMPVGTQCFLTSFKGDLETNSFTDGAWATVDYTTGVWTFKAASGVTAWWLCLD